MRRFGRSGGAPISGEFSGRYWSIGKIAGMVLTLRVLKWTLNPIPSKRFFCKCFVWMTAGQIAEIYRQWGPVNAEDAVASEEMNAACKGKL